MTPPFQNQRRLLINDRVQAAVSLFGIMAITTIIVFGGVEVLMKIPNLDENQRLFLMHFHYPILYKIMFSLCWCFISVLSAFLFLTHRYRGFFNRMTNFFYEVKPTEPVKTFKFRKKDKIIRQIDPSLNDLLLKWSKEVSTLTDELHSLRDELSSLSTETDSTDS